MASEALGPGTRGLGEIPDDRAVLLVEDEDLTRVARPRGVAQGGAHHEAVARYRECRPKAVPGACIRVQEGLEERAGRVEEVCGAAVARTEVVPRCADEQA